MSATDTTADAVAIAGGAGCCRRGTAGTAGAGVAVAADGTITLLRQCLVRLATHVSSLNLGTITDPTSP